VKSLLDADSKGWPWNSGYIVGSAAALFVADEWGLHVAAGSWLAINAVWLTVAGLKYRAQRRATRQ
jgi:hypothetical protein